MNMIALLFTGVISLIVTFIAFFIHTSVRNAEIHLATSNIHLVVKCDVQRLAGTWAGEVIISLEGSVVLSRLNIRFNKPVVNLLNQVLYLE